jgi:hypothetical protein
MPDIKVDKDIEKGKRWDHEISTRGSTLRLGPYPND